MTMTTESGSAAFELLQTARPQKEAYQDTQTAPVAESKLSRVMDRREFLGKYGRAAAVGAVATTGIFTADTIRRGLNIVSEVEDQIWPQSEPSLTFLDCDVYRGQTKLGIYSPGFGDMHGAQEAADWKQYGKLPPGLLTGFIDYSSNGMDIKDLPSLVREAVDVSKLEELIMMGTSLGGLNNVYLASQLGVPVKSFMMCSSPSTFRQAYDSTLSHAVTKLPSNPTLATIGKFIATSYDSHHYHDTGLQDSLSTGLDETFSGARPLALQNEDKAAWAINIWDPELFPGLKRSFIPEFSHVAYAATYLPWTDHTVDVVQAGRDYGRLFNGMLGVPYRLFGIKYDGHAHVQATVTGARDWIEATTANSKSY